MPDPTAGSTPARDPGELLALKLVDAVTYAVAFVAVTSLPLGALELAAFGGLIFTKWALFLIGSAFAMYASFHLRPASPKRRAATAGETPSSDTVGNEPASRLGRAAAALPPARWTDLTVQERFSPHAKLLVGALAMLATSWAMEVVFGVGLGA
jgi:hypothetical protein